MSAINLNKTVSWFLPVLVMSLGGCGLTQKVTEGTKSALSTIFYKKVTRLRLDFVAREALNSDARESNSRPEPIVMRVYQLTERKQFDTLIYQQLLKQGEVLLNGSLLASRDVVLKPGSAAVLDMPLEANAQFVAVVGLFRHPDTAKNTWKQVLTREDLEPNSARILEAGANGLLLLPSNQ